MVTMLVLVTMAVAGLLGVKSAGPNWGTETLAKF